MEEREGNGRGRKKVGKAREKREKEEGREMGKEENRKGTGREKGRMKGYEMGKVGRQNWSEEKLCSFLMQVRISILPYLTFPSPFFFT